MRQLLAAAVVAAIVLLGAMASDARVAQSHETVTRSVSGKAVHYFTTTGLRATRRPKKTSARLRRRMAGDAPVPRGTAANSALL